MNILDHAARSAQQRSAGVQRGAGQLSSADRDNRAGGGVLDTVGKLSALSQQPAQGGSSLVPIPRDPDDRLALLSLIWKCETGYIPQAR